METIFIKKVWISQSLLYDETDGRELASSLLSSLLWTGLTGAKVVLQVHNTTPIVNEKHLAILQEVADSQVTVLYSSAVPQQADDVCDLALESALSRMLLFSKLTRR